MPDTTQAALLPQYAQLLASVQIRPAAAVEAAKIRDQIIRNLSSYRNIELKTGICWWWISAIHSLECDLSFNQHLANGDPINRPTIHQPRGIPAGTWEECAIAALKIKPWLFNEINWSNPLSCIYAAERYNGLGYQMYREVRSPYVWGKTTHYTEGKYTADGVWSDTAVSAQVGVAPIWMALGIDLQPRQKVENISVSVSDVSNLAGNMQDNFLVDVAEYYDRKPHQVAALKYLQSQIPDGVLDKFRDEFSPPQPIQKESEYQLRFRLSTATSSDLINGILEFIKDGKTYNKITATSSLPGRQYNGSWNRKGGLIPPTSIVKARAGVGLSVKTTPIYMPDVIGVSGNFYQISPFTIKTDGSTRGDFGMHADKNTPGSLGCICPVTELGWNATQREFKVLAGLGVRSVELIVEYN